MGKMAKELAAKLDILKEAGIGGVKINPIEFPGDESISMGNKSLDWLSDEWVKIVNIYLI